MSRWSWSVLLLVTACDQAHWECVDARAAVVEAGDVTCDDLAENGAEASWAEAECLGDGCTCRIVTSQCVTESSDE